MIELATVADAADALTNPIQVREPIHYWDVNRNRKVKYYEHRLPSLLDQLHNAVIPGEAYVEDDGGHIHRTPRSIPPARLEAINAIIQIEAGAAQWVRRSNLALRPSVASNVRAMVSAAQVDSDTAELILIDLRRWYGWAATLTGWERPAWRPAAACPICDTRGTLRVRLDRSTAVCVACGAAWTPVNIGLLAEHVRQVAEAAAESRRWAGWAQRDHLNEEEPPHEARAHPTKESTG